MSPPTLRSTRRRTPARLLVIAALALGCTPKTDPELVSSSLAGRIGHGLERPDGTGFELPEGVALEDGLEEDEAVAIALWNAPELRASLTRIGLARADVIAAGTLRNPSLGILFPVDAKQLEFTLAFALDALWGRPKRVEAARLRWQQTANELIEIALDRARDVRIAFSEALRARDAAAVAAEIATLHERGAEIARARVRGGRLAEVDAGLALSRAIEAREGAALAERDAGAAMGRLRAWMGVAEALDAFALIAPDESPAPSHAAEDLVRLAQESRPGVEAARLGVEAAGAGLGWERSRVLQVAAVLDANAEGKKGFEMGPGLDVQIPLFDRNQAGIARAESEIERAAWAYVAVRRRVAQEVEEAHAAQVHASRALSRWRERALPAARQDLAMARELGARGAQSYERVLEAEQRARSADGRAIELEARLREALAVLERSLGRKLDADPG